MSNSTVAQGRISPSALLRPVGKSNLPRPFTPSSITTSQRNQRASVQTFSAAVENASAPASPAESLTSSKLTWPSRSNGAGTLRETDVGKRVTICGWIDRNRDMGGVQFFDVRDHTGLLQVCKPRCMACMHHTPMHHAPTCVTSRCHHPRHRPNQHPPS